MPSKIFIVSGPAGVGKTTLVKMLPDEFPRIKRSISLPLAQYDLKKRSGRLYLISEQEFKKKIAEGEFLEHVTLYGDHYGTSLDWIENELQKGFHIILVIDTQGALQLKGKIDATFIFISPPSLEALKSRMQGRASESPEQAQGSLRLG